MSVSLIIPHRNRWADLYRCLNSVAKMYPCPEEVIVVDDASDYCKSLPDISPLNIRMVKLQHHRGTAAAKNEGARLAKGDYLWFLDSDSEVVMPDIFKRGLEKFRNTENLCVLGGEGVWDNEESKWKLKLKTFYPNCDTREKLTAPDNSRDFNVEIISTCNFLMPKWLFEKLGGFFSGLEVGEDKEFCWRIRKSSYLLMDSFDFLVAHHTSAAEKELRLSRFFFMNHINQLAVAVLTLPLRSLIFLPFIDLITKYSRFKNQSKAIAESSSAAHGPQARLMGRYRKTLLGRIYLGLIFAYTMPVSYLYTLVRFPCLFFVRLKHKRLIRQLDKGV